MPCEHLTSLTVAEPTTSAGCEDCITIGGRWVHLRMCMTCGHVGCCNDSPNRHAAEHFDKTGHPVIQSFEPGEHWAWCYLDEQAVPDVGVALDRSYP
jgi:uncharacterized UBP type Zn finger protein